MKLSEQEARKMGLTVKKPKRGGKSAGAYSERYPQFDKLCALHGLPAPVHEYRFDSLRKWRLDFVWGDIALEVNGGNFLRTADGNGGAHARGAYLRKHYEKLNAAAIAGYFVLQCMPEDIESGAVFCVIRQALGVEDYP